MLNTILIDSGPLIALFDKDDFHHKNILNLIADKKFKFITTIAVVTEVTHMLDFSVNAQLSFLSWILHDGILINNIDQADLAKIIELTKKYADIPMDFADATLVVVAEKTGIKKIISIDSDFEIYRIFKKVKLENLYKNFG